MIALIFSDFISSNLRMHINFVHLSFFIPPNETFSKYSFLLQFEVYLELHFF
jgi:hypothetical protein